MCACTNVVLTHTQETAEEGDDEEEVEEEEEEQLFEKPTILLDMMGPPAKFALDDLRSINLPEPEEGSEFTKMEKMILIHAVMGKMSARSNKTFVNIKWDWIVKQYVKYSKAWIYGDSNMRQEDWPRNFDKEKLRKKRKKMMEKKQWPKENEYPH
jgi:hypothetical protein